MKIPPKIRNNIDESVRLEAEAKAAKKAGNKDLAADLSAQAKKLTSEAELLMTDWVRVAQYKGNTEFFQ